MLPPIPVVLAEYHSDWPCMAGSYAESLRSIGLPFVAVHHIGSTAVPGLIAKPILDLMPLVTDLAVLDRGRTRVEALGYVWHGEMGIPDRRYCTLSDENGVRVVQLHCFEEHSPHVRRHLAFRDYLRAHAEVARAYADEKRRARNLHPEDSHAYADEKAAWIRDIEVVALLPEPPARLPSEGVTLHFSRIIPGDFTRGLVPCYHYRIFVGTIDVGHINLRVGETHHVRYCAGHMGYGIAASHRGHQYALRACRALAPWARAIFSELILTCDPDNHASRRTIELLGARLIDEVPVPPRDPHYAGGSRAKLRFLWLP